MGESKPIGRVIEFNVKTQIFKTFSCLWRDENPMKYSEGRGGPPPPFKNNPTKDSVFCPCLVVSIILYA